jgi:glycosyltransferase involved in cell wall biosynthesis
VTRQHIADYFAAADVFVHAAELEAAGNVVLEAMACGTAVVVTDSGGPGEYVLEGVTGFVIPVGDAAALVERLRTLLIDPVLRDRLGRAARAQVELRHAYPRMMADLRAVYDGVLSPASHSRGLPAARVPREIEAAS